MTVKAIDEQKVLETATILDDQMNRYKTNYNIIEKQDLLAMVAFDAVFERLSQKEAHQKMVESAAAEIDLLARQLEH